MPVSGSSSASSPSRNSSSNYNSFLNRTQSNSSRSSSSNTATGIDRYSSATPQPQRSMTPVQQGEAARAADVVKSAKSPTAKSPPASQFDGINVGSTVATRRDGTRVTTVYIDVRANFRVDGGTLPKGQTAESQGRAIERAIERNFSQAYRNPDGSVTRYVTNVNMTVGKAAAPGRTQFVFVAGSDRRLGGGVGMAPGFEKGNTAFIGDNGLARTAPHEFGHLAGLRHAAQFNLGCTTTPRTSIDNLMSQSACSTSQKVERSQLQQIFKTPDFR